MLKSYSRIEEKNKNFTAPILYNDKREQRRIAAGERSKVEKLGKKPIPTSFADGLDYNSGPFSFIEFYLIYFFAPPCPSVALAKEEGRKMSRKFGPSPLKEDGFLLR